MKRLALISLVALLVCWTPILGQDAAAAPAAAEAQQLLPASTVLYAEITQPKRLLATILDHPIAKQIEARPEVQQGLQTTKYKMFRAVISVIEGEIESDWRTALEKLTAGGIFFGVDAETEGAVLLLRSDDAEFLKKTSDTIIRLARMDAKDKGRPDPFRSGDYRGIQAYRAGEGRFAILDRWLVVTNKEKLGKQLLDNYLALKAKAPTSDTLARDKRFQAARANSGKPSGWGYVNIAAFRDAGLAKELFAGKTENPVAELLVGGILDSLIKAEFATIGLDVKQEQLALSFRLPHQPDWTSEPREYFFGPSGQGAAPAVLRPRDTLLSISTYRDLPAMWAASEELYIEGTVAKIAQAESNLSNLFSGRDFGQEVLGSIGPKMQFVLTRQQYPKGWPVPTIKLPSGAVILKLTDPKMARQLNVSFQSLIGLTNFGQAQQGLPQFELSTSDMGDARLVSAVYLADDEPAEDALAPARPKDNGIHHNLSPTLAFIGDQLIVSSTQSLARELVTSLEKGVAEADRAVNTVAVTDIKAVRQILEDNRQHLVSQNMLEKGHDKKQAEKEIGVFFDLLSYLRDFSMQFVAEPEQLRLDVELNLADL